MSDEPFDTGRTHVSTLRLGSKYGTSLEADRYGLEDNTIQIETQGFSDLHGSVPAAYTLSIADAEQLATMLLVNIYNEYDDITPDEFAAIVAEHTEDAIVGQ